MLGEGLEDQSGWLGFGKGLFGYKAVAVAKFCEAIA